MNVLCQALTHPNFYIKLTVREHVGEAVRIIGTVLDGTEGDRINRLPLAWAHLAAAIQKEECSEDELKFWIDNLTSDGGMANAPYRALRHLALTCHEGAVKYGEHNWHYGFPVHDLLNHAQKHLIQWLNGDRTELHLGHTMWGMMAAIHGLRRWPTMCEGLLGPEFSLTEPIKAKLIQHAAHRAAAKAQQIDAVINGQKKPERRRSRLQDHKALGDMLKN